MLIKTNIFKFSRDKFKVSIRMIDYSLEKVDSLPLTLKNRGNGEPN